MLALKLKSSKLHNKGVMFIEYALVLAGLLVLGYYVNENLYNVTGTTYAAGEKTMRHNTHLPNPTYNTTTKTSTGDNAMDGHYNLVRGFWSMSLNNTSTDYSLIHPGDFGTTDKGNSAAGTDIGAAEGSTQTSLTERNEAYASAMYATETLAKLDNNSTYVFIVKDKNVSATVNGTTYYLNDYKIGYGVYDNLNAIGFAVTDSAAQELSYYNPMGHGYTTNVSTTGENYLALNFEHKTEKQNLVSTAEVKQALEEMMSTNENFSVIKISNYVGYTTPEDMYTGIGSFNYGCWTLGYNKTDNPTPPSLSTDGNNKTHSLYYRVPVKIDTTKSYKLVIDNYDEIKDKLAKYCIGFDVYQTDGDYKGNVVAKATQSQSKYNFSDYNKNTGLTISTSGLSTTNTEAYVTINLQIPSWTAFDSDAERQELMNTLNNNLHIVEC